MTLQTSATDQSLWQTASFQHAVLVVGAITLTRVILLFLSPFNLGGDEAQYWDWSRNLDFGYYSKPPMIAWLIRLETSVCGSSEACIRIGSPFLHMGTSLVLFALVYRMGLERLAFWVAIAFITLPAVSFSSGLVSTDVPLLFFWAWALLCLYALLETQHKRWAIGLGIALGLGFLSKYAMVYFVLCLALFLIVSAPDRWLLRKPHIWISGGIGLLFLLPNLLWNAKNGNPTIKHTGDNANWGAELFNLESLADFFVDQLGIFGLFFFPILIWVAGSLIRSIINHRHIDRNFLILLCFSLPIVTIVMVQSFISRANANWAAATYVAATVLVVLWLLQKQKRTLFYVALATNVAVGVFLYTLSLSPALIEATNMGNAFKRVRGWDVIGQHVVEIAAETKSEIILVNDRLILTELLYYAQDTDASFRIWDQDGYVQNHYEMVMPHSNITTETVLLVARYKDPEDILQSFEKTQEIGIFEIPVSENRTRKIHLYRLEGYNG